MLHLRLELARWRDIGVDFQLVIIELFSLALSAEALNLYQRKCVEVDVLKEGGPIWAEIFGGRVTGLPRDSSISSPFRDQSLTLTQFCARLKLNYSAEHTKQ